MVPGIFMVINCIFIVLLVCLVRTFVKIAPHTNPASPLPEKSAKEKERYATHLSQMIRCETLSTPGVDANDAFVQLRAVLEACYPLTHAACERTLFRNSQLMRWPGRDSSKKAILLMAHLDVVPASGEWRYPPFEGRVADGRVWGRGSIDDKGALCAIFEAVEGLISEGFTPPCDVYLLSADDEEIMGDGAPMIRDYLLSQNIGFEIICDEGGIVCEAPLAGVRGLYAHLGVVEKGVANLRFIARSPGGHASTPPKNSPIPRLAAFVDEIERHPPFKKKLRGTLESALSAYSGGMGFGWRFLCRNLWLFDPLVKSMLPEKSPRLAAMMRTTCAFTMAKGSRMPNILPDSASIVANLRPAPHQPLGPTLAVVEEAAKRHGLEVEVIYTNEVTYGVDTEGHAFEYFKRCVAKAFPEARPVPTMVLFGTDARRFAHLCDCTIRFSPYRLSVTEQGMMHAVDESIGMDTLARAVQFYEIFLRDYRSLP